MNKDLNKRFLLISFILHLIILLLMLFFYPNSKLRKSFLVYGLHSKHKTETYFKMLKAPPGARFMQSRRKRSSASGKKGKSKKNPVVAKQSQIAKQSKVADQSVKEKKPEPKKLAKKEKKPIDKKEEKKIDTKKEEEKKLIAKKEPYSAKASKGMEEDQLHFNVVGEADPVFIKYQGYVQQEIERTWQPPLGVKKGTECTAVFTIDSDGSVKNFELTKRSKMLIYDLSVIKVSKLFKFDRCLWGKTFKIDFRQ